MLTPDKRQIYYTAYASKTGDQGKLSLWTTEAVHLGMSGSWLRVCRVQALKTLNPSTSTPWMLVPKAGLQHQFLVRIRAASLCELWMRKGLGI